jgi:hypothetical protein
MKNNRGSILIGILLVLVGGWLLLQQFGVNVPGLDKLWPGFIVLGGGLSLVSFFRDRKPDQMFVGVAGILVGGFFFLFTFGRLNWQEDMRRYWPAFLIILSLATLAQWLTIPSRRGYLVQAGIALFIGLFFFAYNFNLFNQTLTRQILMFWPVLLILAGLITLVRTIRKTT